MKKDLSKISLKPISTIAQALSALESNLPSVSGLPAGIALVVDQKGVLAGIVTDSDLRHALTCGEKTSAKLERIMNKKPFTVSVSLSDVEILSAISEETRTRGWDAHKLDKIILVNAAGKPVSIMHRAELEYAADVRVKRIGVVGLGFVGLTLALSLADTGFSVFGYDTNPRVNSLLRKKKAPFFEQGLDDVLTEHAGKRFNVVRDFRGEHGCDVYFVAVGTPVSEKGVVDRSHLSSASVFIAKHLKHGDMVILRSTVPIGTTRDHVVPLLEKGSGLRAGSDFHVAFAPERTIAGKAFEELRTLPQIIGGINRASANAAAEVFSTMTDVVHIVDSLEEAEAVKLVNNTYRDVMFAFANEVALIFRAWGLDTGNILHAANAGYVRGGVPRPSPGVGGYCLTKDPFIFIESAKQKGHTPLLFARARELHTSMLNAISTDVVAFLKKSKKKKSAKIAILGFGFKGNPPTSDMRGSSTVDLVKLLHAKGYKNIHGFDPVIGDRDIKALGVRYQKTSTACMKDADVVVVMTNHPSFSEIDMVKLLRSTSNKTLFLDTWSLYSKEKIGKMDTITYRAL